MAITPFLVYHAAANYSRTKDFAVKTDFIQIWLASLAAFILLRGSGNSSGYEAQFYNSTEPGLLRYAELSAIYAVMGYLFVTLWRLPDMPNVKTAAGMIASRTFSLLASFLLFTFSLFIIET
jgi:hypothetical protein